MTKRVNTYSKQFLIILASIFSVLILVGGLAYYEYEASVIRKDCQENLTAIAGLKLSQISQWRTERQRDISYIYRNPLFEKGTQEMLSNVLHPERFKEIFNQLTIIKENSEYEDVFLTSPTGEMIYSVDHILTSIDSVTKKFILESARQKTVLFTDLYYCPLHKKIHYDLIIPLLNKNNITIAVIVLRIDPSNYLFPLIESWPTHSKSSEILIVRKDRDSVLFLNELRHRTHTAMIFRLPMSRTSTPAVKAVSGYQGIMEGTDYRGIKVLSFVCNIPGTEWFMVAKVDRSEIFSELNYRIEVIIFVTIILILLTTIGISRIYYFRQREIYKELYRKEKILTETQDEYRTTLYNIDEGIITTDDEGLILQMNRVAGILTGWDENTSKGKPIGQVINVVNEATRDRIELPFEKVFRNESVARIPELALLLSLNGTETPVGGYCSPVKHDDQHISGIVLVLWDKSEEIEAGRKLKESEELYRGLFENMLNGFAYCKMEYEKGDPSDFMYLSVNHAFEPLTGLKDVVGKKVSEVIPEFRKTDMELLRTYNRVASTGIPETFEVYVESLKTWYNISVYCPEKGYFVAVFDVITKRKMAEANLKLTNISLERSNKELEQFAYVASHDLQEPLRMISSFTQLLFKRYNEKMGKDADEFIHFIVDGASRMQRLIQDLLLYSRINTQGGSFKSVDSMVALGEAIANLQMSIMESSAIVSNDDLPVINGDFSQLVQLFQNLIGNAIRFHGEEPPRIHVSASSDNENWIFSVKDNGIGIDAAYFEKIFIIFQRLHPGSTYPGTGIGLAICKRIVNRHEGKIWVESEPGKGSVFYFTIKR
jgi:PAS domain S-box-containing protein